MSSRFSQRSRCCLVTANSFANAFSSHLKVPFCMPFGAIIVTAILSFTSSMVYAQTIYIPEGSANSVLVVDGANGSTIRRIDGLEAVHGLSGTANSGVLVAGSLIETDKPVEAPASVTADEHTAHHGASGKAIGPDIAGISILSIIDRASGTIIRRLEVPGAVHHTAMSPDGRYAVATHPGADGISIIDLSNYEVTGWVPTGPMPNYAIIDQSSQTAFVTNTGNGTVSEVDLARAFVRRNFLAGEAPEHMAYGLGTGTLYIADSGTGRVIELDVNTGKVLRDIAIDSEVHGLDLSDDGKRLFVAVTGSDAVASINLKSGSIATYPLGSEPYHVTTIPNSGQALVSSRANPEAWVVDISSGAVVKRFQLSGVGHQMVVVR